MIVIRLHARRRRAGFTLVELMTVVTIIGVVASLAVMAFRRTRSEGDSDAWANTIRNAVTLARRRATATSTPYMIEVGPTTLSWCQVPAGSCAGDAAMSCATVAGCMGSGTTCERGTPLYAGSDALTDSWSATADALAQYAGNTPVAWSPATRTALAGTKALYFGPAGSVDDKCSDALVSPPDPNRSPGFTLYVRAANVVPSATSEQQKRRRVVVYGVTGRPRIIDQW